LAVFGIGGLGHVAVQLGKYFGAEVTAIDISDAKLELARTLGASDVFNAASTDVAKQLRRSGGIHVSLVSSGAKAAYDMAFYCLRPTGTLLVVGLPSENICFPPILMAAGEIKIEASAVGTRQDLREVLALAAAGKLRCQVESRTLSQVNQVLDDLRRGRAAGRIVLTPQ
jgi:alcohol dehydrogenase, propanol-preferring